MKSLIRFSMLASGSKGNACYIETHETKILIDAGLSCRETEHRLGLIGVRPAVLDALVVTHEHSDHIKGAGPMSRRFNIPVFINHKTLEKKRKTLGNLSKPVIIQTGQTLTINDVNVETFTKCHDAVDPIGIVVSVNGTRIGLATDLGRSTGLVEDRLKGCRALIVEFNYDQRMLEQSSYPLALKRRINSSDGHLSNKQGAALIRAVYDDNLQHVILAHLSEENNNPEIARVEGQKALNECGLSQTKVTMSRQNEPTPLIELK